MRRLGWLCFLLPIAACDCGGTPPPSRPCVTNIDCPADQRCVDMYCVDITPDGGIDTGEPGCEDTDGDGYGPGCSRGDDCDPNDRTQTGVEVCDGLDNDCDGVADNGVLSECGDCDSTCMLDGLGPEGDPFDPETDESDGVGVDDDGALILDSSRINTNFIWIANTAQGTVSRFNTETYAEEGRYLSGPAGTGNDPSRTSVNSLGDVYVGNRNGNTVSRISVLGSDCPDTNGDGVITTSTDGTHLPTWGQDDCILWNTSLESVFPGERHVRAVAAQDVEGPDGELLQYVWVGGWDTQMIAKLDGVTGAILFATPAPCRTYGFALDGSGNLWVSTRDAQRIGRVDTTRCVDAASCADPVCDGEGAGDACVKQTVAAPIGGLPYGITVDFNQRVWIGGNDIGRYDPAAAPGSRWQRVNLSYAGGIAVHGIAADAAGWVWGASQGTGVVRVDADTPTSYQIVASTTGTSNKGMAVDGEGKIWSITQTNEAVVITPGATIDAATVERGIANTIVNPYTYSDMTGLQLRLATNPRGYYRHVYEACPDGSAPAWGELRFEAETPAGTSVSFRVKTAATRDGLADADWISLGTVPPDASPLFIGEALTAAGVMPGRFLMLEISLAAERMSSTMVITPRVLGVDVTHSCPPVIG